eukprot:jgi/Bigna1/139200/aug1.49_g13908
MLVVRPSSTVTIAQKQTHFVSSAASMPPPVRAHVAQGTKNIKTAARNTYFQTEDSNVNSARSSRVDTCHVSAEKSSGDGMCTTTTLAEHESGGLRLFVVYYLIGQGWTVEDESEGRLWATLKKNNEVRGNLLLEVFSEGESGSRGALRVRRLADRTRPYFLKEAVALKALIEELEELNVDSSIPDDKRLFFLENSDTLQEAKELIMKSVA